MSTPLSFVSLLAQLRQPEAATEEMFWQKLWELRVAVPCVVVSFDEDAQTIVAQPTIQENILLNGVPTPTNIPPLHDVPVAIYRAGGFSITLPITAGDECMVVFQDMAIDSWWQNGGTQNNQVERRRHDLSDAIAVFGLCSQASRTISGYSTSALQIRSDDGQVAITVKSGQVIATPDGGTTTVTLSAGNATVVATNIKLQGDVEVTGTFTADGNVYLHGAEYLTHEHTDVTSGSSNTGPVFP